MKITASKIERKPEVKLEKVYDILHTNTIRYCNALRELYELGFTESPYEADDVLLRKAFIQEFDDSKYLMDMSSGCIDFSLKHLDYACVMSDNEEFKKVCDVYKEYISARDTLKKCDSLIKNVKILRKGIYHINSRFIASEGVVCKSNCEVFPELFLDYGCDMVSVNIGDCVIHALMLDIGISEEEYQKHLSTGESFFIKGVTQEEECEFIDLIISCSANLNGKYGKLLSERILNYYKDFTMNNKSKFVQASYDSMMFTKSADFAMEKLNKVRKEIYEVGGHEIFMTTYDVYYEIPSEDEYKFELDKVINVGGWCTFSDGERIFTKDLFYGVQGEFTKEGGTVPAFLDGFGVVYFAENAHYTKSSDFEQIAEYDSISKSELRLLVKKFVTSELALDLIMAVFRARCDEFEYELSVDTDNVVEDEYCSACEEAIEALKYTFNII